MIAYQARIDDYLKATAAPEPATTAATNTLAAWLTAVGAILVVLVMLTTAARDGANERQHGIDDLVEVLSGLGTESHPRQMAQMITRDP